MKLFKLDPQSKQLAQLVETNLTQKGFTEPRDLENWVSSHTNLFGRPILWLCKQDRPTDSDRSDLIGLDAEAEVVVVELKRGTVEIDALTQGLRYLPEYRRKSRDELVALLAANKDKPAGSKLAGADFTIPQAAQKIDAFTGGAAELNETQSLLLVGTDFSAEILAACQYLNEASGDDATFSVECWQLKMFDDAGAHYLTFAQLVPTPDLRVEIDSRREKRSVGKYKRDSRRINFMQVFKAKAWAAGWQCWSNRGQSYRCYLQKQPSCALEFSIHGTRPALSTGKPADLDFGKVDARWRDTLASTGLVEFDPVDFDSPAAFEAAAQLIVSQVSAIVPAQTAVRSEAEKQ